MLYKRKNAVVVNIGDRHEQLVLLEDLGMVNHVRMGRFQCDCGVVCDKSISNVFRGKIKTCGHLFEQLNNGRRYAAIKKIEQTEEGFFNVDEYFKSDFILQS